MRTPTLHTHARARRAGQGLVVSGAPAPLGASGAFSSLAALYEKSKAWKAAFRRSPASACASGGDTLCSAGAVDGNAAAYGQLVVATSPLIYSSARPADTGGFDFIPDPRDQRPCAACTGFAVAAAAQAAVAAAARVNASDVEPLSAADLVYCSPGAPTSCSAGWTLADVLKQLTERRIAPEACMPYDVSLGAARAAVGRAARRRRGLGRRGHGALPGGGGTHARRREGPGGSGPRASRFAQPSPRPMSQAPPRTHTHTHTAKTLATRSRRPSTAAGPPAAAPRAARPARCARALSRLRACLSTRASRTSGRYASTYASTVSGVEEWVAAMSPGA